MAKANFKRKENRNVICFAVQRKESDLALKTQKIKCKICLQIFDGFKKNENYKSFKKFAKIEKSLFSNCYEKLSKMAADIRDIFNEYFITLASDAVAYPKAFSLFAHFENLYKEHESKKLLNETNNILEIRKKMNKLQKVVKQNKYAGTYTNSNFSSGQENRFPRMGENEAFHAHEANREKRISNKFKLELLNNIKGLNTEQIRGMLKLLQDSSNGLDAQSATSVELDINKLSVSKIKELDKYVRRCFLEMKNREFRGISFDNNICATNNANRKLGSLNMNMNCDKFNREKDYCKSESWLLGKKHNRDFFAASEDKNFNNNYYDSELYYVEQNNKNNIFNNSSMNKICIANNISSNALQVQNSFTNAETPNSNINKSKFERGNSLDIESDAESDESSDEESYSDLEIGNFKI